MTRWIQQHAFALAAIALFAVCFLFFVYLTSAPTFADPDSFYHVKMAQYIAEGKDIRSFPWLPFTVLNTYYTDQHYLYHVFLAPFVSLFGPFVGGKLATALLGSALVTFFAVVLRHLKIRFPLLYAFLLLIVLPFIFRISLTKAPAFSLIVLFAGLLFAWKRKRVALLITAFLYVWSYGGFILLPAFVLLLVAMRLFAGWWQESAWLKSKHIAFRISWRGFFKRLVRKPDIQVALLVVLGTVVGIVANPFFPNNLKYLNDQLFQIGVINYQHVIGVGGEWYPYAFKDLMANTIVLSILVVCALVWGAIHIKKLQLRTWYAFLLFVFFLLFTLKSRRYVEYYVPFGMLFCASSFSDCLSGISFRHFWQSVKKNLWTRYTFLSVGLAAYAIIALTVIVTRDVASTKRDLSGGFKYAQDRDASLWLKNHIPKQAIVVHSDWDEFPYLFFWNDQNRYIAGLDPTFLYKASKDRYWAWANITLGKTTSNISGIISTTLQSGYFLVESGHDTLISNLQNDPNMREVYRDAEVTIFALKGATIL